MDEILNSLFHHSFFQFLKRLQKMQVYQKLFFFQILMNNQQKIYRYLPIAKVPEKYRYQYQKVTSVILRLPIGYRYPIVRYPEVSKTIGYQYQTFFIPTKFNKCYYFCKHFYLRVNIIS